MQLWCVFKEDNLHVLGWSSVWFVKNFNIGMFSDTINKIDVKLNDGTTHLALPFHYSFSDPDIISRSQQCQAVLTENFMFLSS